MKKAVIFDLDGTLLNTLDDLADSMNFALKSGSLIVFDAAYESFITDDSLPHSIFEIEGARDCAIEVCSLSKSAGFTGIRCGWTAIPDSSPLHALWKRRQNTKFNGASYISQRGALIALSDEGISQTQENVRIYSENAQKLARFLKKSDIFFTGGIHAPYLWFKCPFGMDSWQFFDYLLSNSQIVGTPGVGFGSFGEGFFRFSSFAEPENIDLAIHRMKKLLG